MPINRCKINNNNNNNNNNTLGYRWGSGTCFKTRAQALKQMRAIKASETKKKK